MVTWFCVLVYSGRMQRIHQYSPLESKLKNYTIKNGCWEYNGCTNDSGYCLIMVDGKLQYAHRIAYEHHIGKIPQGMTVDHICFNRKCINPAHLRLLTPSENAKRHKQNQEKPFCGICGEKKVRSLATGRLYCRQCGLRRAKKHRQKNAHG